MSLAWNIPPRDWISVAAFVLLARLSCQPIARSLDGDEEQVDRATSDEHEGKACDENLDCGVHR